MPSLYTEIKINASKRRVWQVLFNKATWMYWNTFLYDCNPNLPFKQGQEVLLALRRLPGEEETEFQPVVKLVQPEACLKWASSIPGFANEHVFDLQETGHDRTQYIHHENFSGALSHVFLPFIRRDEEQGMRRMARELKQYVERE